MKNLLKGALALTLAFTLFASVNVVNVDAKKVDNTTAFINAYKKKDYKKARTYYKKLPKTYDTKCPKSYKKAYTKIVKKYKVFDPASTKAYLEDFFYTDIDNDKKVELLTITGTCEADFKLTVYRGAKKLGSVGASHAFVMGYPKHNGILLGEGHMGYEEFTLVTVKKNKLVTKDIGSRDIGKGDYFASRGLLKNHVVFDKNSNAKIRW